MRCHHINCVSDSICHDTSAKRGKLHLESYVDRKTASMLYGKNIEDILPLSSAQEVIVDDYINGYGQDYHEQTAFHLVGDVDTAKLKEAFQLFVIDYPTLRVVYPKDLPRKQVLLSNSQVEVETLPKDSNVSFDCFLRNISQKDWREKFDIETGPLMRAVIQKKNDQEWYIFMGFSGLATDGWSFSTLLERLFVIYNELIKNNKYVQQPDYSYLNYCRRNPGDDSKNNLKAANKDYSSTILSKICTIDADLTSDLQQIANDTNITMSEMMLRIVAGATRQEETSRIFVYTHGREDVYDAMQSVGPYSKRVAYEADTRKNVPIPLIYTGVYKMS
jgi:Condensation domain